jgi:chromosome segregation ATPase
MTIHKSGLQIAELEKEDSRNKTTNQQLKKQILSADLKIQEQQEQLTTVEEKLKTQVQRAEAAEFECAAHVQTMRELNAEVGHLETIVAEFCAEQLCGAALLLQEREGAYFYIIIIIIIMTIINKDSRTRDARCTPLMES